MGNAQSMPGPWGHRVLRYKAKFIHPRDQRRALAAPESSELGLDDSSLPLAPWAFIGVDAVTRSGAHQVCVMSKYSSKAGS